VVAQFDSLFKLRDLLREAVNAEGMAEQAEERCAKADRDCKLLDEKLQSMASSAKSRMDTLEAEHQAAVVQMDAAYDRAEASRRADHDATMKERKAQLDEVERSLDSERAKLEEVTRDRQLVQNELSELTAKLERLKQSVAGITA